MNHTQAFSNIADIYSRYRPNYPESLVQKLKARIPNTDSGNMLIIDIGCGTGIFTRQLIQVFGKHACYIGIDPSQEMIYEARNSTLGEFNVQYQVGVAEELPFSDGTVQLITCAQAVQWFNRVAFYSEVKRVLCEGGVLAIIQNNRAWKRSSLLEEYEKLLEKYGDNYTRNYRSHDYVGELSSIVGLGKVQYDRYEWIRRIEFDDFIGMCFSSTKMQAVKKNVGEEESRRMLKDLIRSHIRNDSQLIDIPYDTELFSAIQLCGN